MLQLPEASPYSPHMAAAAAAGDGVQLLHTDPQPLMFLVAAVQAAYIHRTAAPVAAAEPLPGAAAVVAVVRRSLSAAAPCQALMTECSLLVLAEYQRLIVWVCLTS